MCTLYISCICSSTNNHSSNNTLSAESCSSYCSDCVLCSLLFKHLICLQILFLAPSLQSWVSLKFFLPLGYCHLNGSIPFGIGKLKHLISLDVQMNSINGHIPEQIEGCEELQKFAASNNMLQ